MPAQLGDLTPSMRYVGDYPVSRTYLGDDLVWAAYLDFADSFDQTNGPLDTSTKYEYVTGSPYLNLPPTVVSNHLEAQDPGNTDGNTIFGLTLVRKRLNYTNRRVEFDLLGPISSVAQAGLVARATDDGMKSIQFNIVAASHGGISNQDTFTATNRTSYDQAQLAVNDRCGFEVYGDQYVAYRIRSGVRVNLTGFRDSGGALVPLTATRYGFYIIAARQSGQTYKGAPFDNFHAWDLPDRVAGQFIESGVRKSASSAWATSATWVDITGMASDTACPGSVAASNGVTVRGNKTAANFTAWIPWTGANSSTRQHTVRIVRVSDGLVVATGTTATGTSGVATCTATRDVIDGEVYKVQMNGNTTINGNITAATAFFQIT